jgi:hypothetical protein
VGIERATSWAVTPSPRLFGGVECPYELVDAPIDPGECGVELGLRLPPRVHDGPFPGPFGIEVAEPQDSMSPRSGHLPQIPDVESIEDDDRVRLRYLVGRDEPGDVIRMLDPAGARRLERLVGRMAARTQKSAGLGAEARAVPSREHTRRVGTAADVAEADEEDARWPELHESRNGAASTTRVQEAVDAVACRDEGATKQFGHWNPKLTCKTGGVRMRATPPDLRALPTARLS